MTKDEPITLEAADTPAAPAPGPVAGEPAAAATKPASVHGVHRGGLLAIGAFKLANSLFYVAVGIGALRLVHKDLSAMLLHLAHGLRFDPEGRLVQALLEKVPLVDAHRLRQIGAFTFTYAALHAVEGIGLLLEKTWAEYITVILTGSFIPWELYELLKHPGWFKVLLLSSNLAVLGYLAWLLSRKRMKEQEQAPPSQ